MIFLHMHHFSVQACILNVLADAAAQQKRSAEELFLFRFIPRHIKFYSRKLRFHDSKKKEKLTTTTAAAIDIMVIILFMQMLMLRPRSDVWRMNKPLLPRHR